MTWVLILISAAYLGLIFLAAWYFERRFTVLKLQRLMPYIYSLALAVYCTAWTFYGSIGRAVESGLDYIMIYLGPTLAMFIWYPLAKKLMVLKRNQGIASLADLISARYGKSQQLGALVAILSLVAVLPYISLQIKAISESYILLNGSDPSRMIGFSFFDPALYVSLAMALFTLLFGTRYVQSTKPKPGLIGAIAAESLFKLLAFLTVAIISLLALKTEVSWVGLEYTSISKFENLSALQESLPILIISFFAFMLLPRQFQMGLTENTSVRNIPKALWLFPLYLLLINLFVFPLSHLGKELFPTANSDYFLLLAGQKAGGAPLALLAYLGGLSAASSMIIVSTLALGNMISTYWLVPRFALNHRGPQAKTILSLRRWAIGGILILAYLYYETLGQNSTLVSIGMVSFVAIAQFAPSFLGALYWKEAKRKAAFQSILVGFGLWFYFLILPDLMGSQAGGLGVLHPRYLSSQVGMSQLSLAVWISLGLNTLTFVSGSFRYQHNQEEANQATLFTEALKLEESNYQPNLYRSSAPFPDIRTLLINVLGKRRTTEVLDRYARLNNIDWQSEPEADSKMISYAERLLAEAIGPASAKIMIASVAQRQDLSPTEVLGILEESQKVIALNRELSKRSTELKRATEDLQEANQKLQEFAELKDEFLYTVTHELRTPLTAIRSQAELIYDDADMPEGDRQHFLGAIVKDCDRLTRLITSVLDLEKYESGSMRLNLGKHRLDELIESSLASFKTLAEEQNIRLHLGISAPLPITYLDQDRITQVLQNLISNALKFARSPGGEVWVTAYTIDDQIKVNVHDNGLGIPDSDRDLVFDKFYQVRHQTRRKPSGSGLGLAICKNIIQMHKGKIWVEANKGGGAKLCFSLPLYQNLPQNHKA